jgi:hypothetical protein
VRVELIGEVGGDGIEVAAGEVSLRLPVEAAAAAWRSLGERFDAPA